MKPVNIILMIASVGILLSSSIGYSASIKKSSAPAFSQTNSGGKSSGRNWILTLPIVADQPQLGLHLEYNVEKMAGVALELASIGSVEELGSDEVKKTGNSLKVNGMQGALIVSRYTDESNLSGFFWSLGAGYRKWTGEWKKKQETPDQREPVGLKLTDDDGFLHHRVQGDGVTGHARVGYRYVATEWPLAIGLHLGFRHMNTKVKDVTVSEKDQQKLDLVYSKVTNTEKKTLQNRMMTTPDFAINVGFAF